MELVHPLVTLALLVLMALAHKRSSGVSFSKGFVWAAFGLVVFVGVSALGKWTDEDASRQVMLLVVMVGVAAFALFQIVKQRAGRRPPTTKPQDRNESL